MPHVLYTAFDLVPSPKGAGTHIMHFLRGLVKAGYDVQLMTPGDGQLPAIDTYEGTAVIRVPPPPDRNFLAHALGFGAAVLMRINALRCQGMTLPSESTRIEPLESDQIKEYLR